MDKFHSSGLPSHVIENVRLTRQHYYDHLISELKKCWEIADSHNKSSDNTNEHWEIVTDFEQENIGTKDMCNQLINNEISLDRSYRQDISIIKSETCHESILCWPVVHDILSDKLFDDFPMYPKCSFTIGNTSIEMNSFCWFACEIIFYPNADSVKSLIDRWFSKWYYPRKKITSPFLNVLHKIDGPFSEQEGCELYWVDFGSAPSTAFWDLLKLICHEDVKRLVIK